ncbi:MAG: hypothetical protein BEU03_02175 [Marine Group III euryarchaeote CG-Epi6]|uniref:FAD-binding domain-containing protein n=1 Tax=Marine Group III euryarchaeote CG-Epi6 TaxID=1889000 RepID=A0A1J5SXX9_9ARCH|nr:MAG: hypothetical protein BEU03_02175 [Marine Group III euryarchaeote CG-Epi6]
MPNKTNFFWEKNIVTKAIPDNEMKFDVIVVGGGPAGSAAACYAADEGLKVLLLEKDNYPRDKVCGDAVGGKALKHLEELKILDTLEKSPHFIFDSVIFSNTKEEKVKVEIKDSEAKGYVYPRLNFDWIMFNEAKSRVENKGGFVIQNFRVNSLLIDDKDNERIIGIKGKNEIGEKEFYAPITIGAGGVNCPVAKTIITEINDEEFIEKEHWSSSFRQYWKNVENVNYDKGAIEFHYVDGVIPGYFWIFPVGKNTCNVGLGITLKDLKNKEMKLKELQKYIIEEKFANRFRNAELIKDSGKGWQLPLGSPRKTKMKLRRMFGNGCLLIGDAGSLVDPFTGEGIGNALLSAKIAIKHCKQNKNKLDLKMGERYQSEIWNILGKELTNSFKIQNYTRKKWLINWFIGKAQRKPELQKILSESLTSKEAQRQLTSPWTLFKNLVF